MSTVFVELLMVLATPGLVLASASDPAADGLDKGAAIDPNG